VNLSWNRTAAQAALALKLHGVLETTGCQSASAKLLHASLPTIHSSGGYSSWNDIDNDDIGAIHFSSSLNNNNNNGGIEQPLSNNKKMDSGSTFECGGGGDDNVTDTNESDLMVCEFEKGVVSIKNELKGETAIDEEGETLDSCCDEYDMLPAPMSLSKRSALCAGSTTASFPNKQPQQGNIERNDSFSSATSNEFYNPTQSCSRPTPSTENWDHHHHRRK